MKRFLEHVDKRALQLPRKVKAVVWDTTRMKSVILSVVRLALLNIRNMAEIAALTAAGLHTIQNSPGIMENLHMIENDFWVLNTSIPPDSLPYEDTPLSCYIIWQACRLARQITPGSEHLV